jgi:hypothetical protein
VGGHHGGWGREDRGGGEGNRRGERSGRVGIWILWLRGVTANIVATVENSGTVVSTVVLNLSRPSRFERIG